MLDVMHRLHAISCVRCGYVIEYLLVPLSWYVP